jgi:uncharacterized protein
MKAKQERRELEKLYAEIPKFKCIEGCTDCCGPVPATRDEKRLAPLLKGAVEQVENFVDESILSWCASCPYARPGHGCAIYNDRPLLCRLFGTSESPDLTCRHGCHSEKQFTVAQTNRLMARYLKLFSPEDRQEQYRLHLAWQKKYEQEPELPRHVEGSTGY